MIQFYNAWTKPLPAVKWNDSILQHLDKTFTSCKIKWFDFMLIHVFKDWSTLFCLHWDMKRHWSHVNLVKRFSKIYTRPVSFHFQMQTNGPKGHITCTWVQCATFLKDQPGWPFLFTYWPNNRKHYGGCWDLGSCQVSLNSVQWFRRKSRIISANERPGQPFCFSDQPEKHKLSRGCWDLASI